MIGNSIPPVLTYYLFQSMLERPLKDLKLIKEKLWLKGDVEGTTYTLFITIFANEVLYWLLITVSNMIRGKIYIKDD